LDKLLHFVAGAAIALLVIMGSYAVHETYDIPMNKEITIVAGVTTGVIAGIAKEGYDSMGYGTVEALDIVATSLGAMSIAVLSYLLLP
jgi:hypothetical protein